MLSVTDTTTTAQADALAEIARHELAATIDRHADSVTWTAREHRLITWMYQHATIQAQPREVRITAPAGRTSQRYSYLLYAVLERAAGTLEATPWAVSFEELEGANLPHGGQLTW